jgi:uncharacterized protein (DUF1800 family)
MGAHPDLVAHLDDPHAAIMRALDRSGPPVVPLELAVPTDVRSGDQVRDVLRMVDWWVDRMRQPDHLVEERMTWFWHDHFATSVQKVRVPYLVLQQHVMLRQHALGNFAELLKAVARDPAMLIYLDGITNSADQRNENFGRECLELFTMGRDDGYTQDDVVAASRAFTGWVVVLPNRPVLSRLGAPWSSVFIPRRHDGGTKTLLGTTGTLDMDGALDVVLERPQTARFITTKLWRELVGLEPDDETVETLARDFRRSYEIRPLVEAIVEHDQFTADAAVRSRYRSPVEKLVGIVQASDAATENGVPTASGSTRRGGKQVVGPARALRTMSYLPFLPPNVAGFPKGARLLGPSNLVHTFDLVQAVDGPPRTASVDDLMARFGIHDVSNDTRDVLHRERDPGRRFVLAAASPEYSLT